MMTVKQQHKLHIGLFDNPWILRIVLKNWLSQDVDCNVVIDAGNVLSRLIK
ncbi:hypothetical protein SAMN04488128_104205 [Chitinophaga eiseniae]|uniref:Uncharacterized protein n=1 Tax=Chitinophaga eiseniae TaxID=634771 RepID=A0A1T4T9Z3_9BACT|nr:hypothetical protein SAMN04488128_104205 [Chitinophaga eiseniae]